MVDARARGLAIASATSGSSRRRAPAGSPLRSAAAPTLTTRIALHACVADGITRIAFGAPEDDETAARAGG